MAGGARSLPQAPLLALSFELQCCDHLLIHPPAKPSLLKTSILEIAKMFTLIEGYERVSNSEAAKGQAGDNHGKGG